MHSRTAMLVRYDENGNKIKEDTGKCNENISTDICSEINKEEIKIPKSLLDALSSKNWRLKHDACEKI